MRFVLAAGPSRTVLYRTCTGTVRYRTVGPGAVPKTPVPCLHTLVPSHVRSTAACEQVLQQKKLAVNAVKAYIQLLV